MNHTIEKIDNKVIVTFGDKLEKLQITAAFLEVVEKIDIKKVKHLIFDCSRVTDYEIPDDYMTRVKVVTLFSTSWNAKVNAIFIANDKNIIKMVTGFINHKEDLKWKYFLFKSLEETLNWCEKN